MSNKSYLSVYAKSFNWAGFFLPKETLKKCSALYDFCRVADNIADDDDKIENKKKKFDQFENDFNQKKFDDPVIRNMWSLIEEFKISLKIVEDFYLTPDYFEKDLNTKYGSGFSIQPKFSQSAYFRFHNKSEIYDGLYFVGAGTHPGAGVPGVLS